MRFQLFVFVVQDMIAHFTENIYDIGIALSVSGGDPAPLVGHNAFLRWVGPSDTVTDYFAQRFLRLWGGCECVWMVVVVVMVVASLLSRYFFTPV